LYQNTWGSLLKPVDYSLDEEVVCGEFATVRGFKGTVFKSGPTCKSKWALSLRWKSRIVAAPEGVAYLFLPGGLPGS
jgi:hypothetical protein